MGTRRRALLKWVTSNGENALVPEPLTWQTGGVLALQPMPISALSLLKALAPRLVSVEGRITVLIDVQLLKALLPIVVTPLFTSMPVRAAQ